MLKRIYTAHMLAEAHLVRETLVEAGIDAHLAGTMRPSLAGEIPIPDAVVEVWVDDSQEEEARALLARLDEAARGEEWTCACGEANPATFEVCWHCGKARPSA